MINLKLKFALSPENWSDYKYKNFHALSDFLSDLNFQKTRSDPEAGYMNDPWIFLDPDPGKIARNWLNLDQQPCILNII